MSTATQPQAPRATAHYRPKTVTLGSVPVTRFIVGANPIGGFAHSTRARDEEMRDWYTMERVQDLYRLAESAGVTTHLGRCDEFIARALRQHWNEGGRLDWIAQTCPLTGGFDIGIDIAVHNRAKCCFLHGGEMDYRVAHGDHGTIRHAVARIRDAGLAAGVAGHRTDTIKWAADNLPLDFFMTCYYNPDDRTRSAKRNYECEEDYRPEDRDAMCALIQELPAPAIHYKVLAAGRHDPREAFEYVADAYRPGDAVCAGIFTKDGDHLIQDNIDLLEAALERRGK